MKRLRLLQTTRGDFPVGHHTVAYPRTYEQHEIYVNPLGAVCVMATNGKWLGVKPGEFEWLEEPAAVNLGAAPHGEVMRAENTCVCAECAAKRDLIRRKVSAFDALAEVTGPEFDTHVPLSIIRAACAGRDLLEVIESALGDMVDREKAERIQAEAYRRKALGLAEEKR